ncbi:MAG: hypothetical protein PHE27_01185, partial [Alphaproteobacteria bacterium]|nr:hypothetical protein [Alphaproteobacteria bacterium]
LPSDRANAPTYTYYSVMYKSGSQYYVLTYIPPATGDSYRLGLLCLPGMIGGGSCGTGQTQVSTTFKDLAIRLSKDNSVSVVAKGVVKNSSIECGTPSTCFVSYGSDPLKFPLPTSSVVPVGSFGIINVIAPCSDCAS